MQIGSFNPFLYPRNTLMFTVDIENAVSLFPEEGEPKSILNAKRGIVSALMVPAMEEDKSRGMVGFECVCFYVCTCVKLSGFSKHTIQVWEYDLLFFRPR